MLDYDGFKKQKEVIDNQKKDLKKKMKILTTKNFKNKVDQYEKKKDAQQKFNQFVAGRISGCQYFLVWPDSTEELNDFHNH